jgi:hypothetical protein
MGVRDSNCERMAMWAHFSALALAATRSIQLLLHISTAEAGKMRSQPIAEILFMEQFGEIGQRV